MNETMLSKRTRKYAKKNFWCYVVTKKAVLNITHSHIIGWFFFSVFHRTNILTSAEMSVWLVAHSACWCCWCYGRCWFYFGERVQLFCCTRMFCCLIVLVKVFVSLGFRSLNLLMIQLVNTVYPCFGLDSVKIPYTNDSDICRCCFLRFKSFQFSHLML